MKRWILGIVLFLAVALPAQAEVQGQEVTYQAGGTVLKGYLAYDDSIEGKCPGVLVVHEWWGHNEYARQRARMLAGLGYTAFALDMYGDGKTASHPDEAKAFVDAIVNNQEEMIARFMAAMKILKNFPGTDPGHIAAIGYCFGGGTVLNMARMGAPLDGVVSFHGGLTPMTEAQRGQIQAKILVCHGGDDQFVTPEQVDAFKQEMDKLGVNYKFIVYPGAKHGFTNPQADEFAKKFNMPIAYNAAADAKSWQDMQEFLKQAFGQGQ